MNSDNTSVGRARRSLGARLRELRRAAGLNGRAFSAAAGWHWSKTSRVELGRQRPSRDDLVLWCRLCDAEDVLADLLATLENIDAHWREWRRITAGGHAYRQRRGLELEARARTLRTYSAILIPGLLQTEPYARAVLAQCIRFLGTHDDLDQAVAARIARQSALRQGNLRLVQLIDQAALHTRVGDHTVMTDQLTHLLDTGFGNPRLVLGVVPLEAGFVYTTTSFDLLDRSTALVETISAELSITTPSELALYEKAWAGLHDRAVFGEQARTLVTQAREISRRP
ncbi:helix-turn-helix transcriptional regulator [Nocardia sp. CNY236]|uniref:helix-turn-helix domain-containing protein n=1 Tax=Nocardia sp. CNY236 TaxID=1169152 RepID=UPI000400580A|nr:helix-turn-helix transcriptional regulator [Nocardia sp. CNY236]